MHLALLETKGPSCLLVLVVSIKAVTPFTTLIGMLLLLVPHLVTKHLQKGITSTVLRWLEWLRLLLV